MTEIDALRYDIEQERKAFDKLYKRHIELLKQQGELEKENEELKSELKGMEELLKSYRKTIKHDAELLADATNNGYLPPLEDWKCDVE